MVDLLSDKQYKEIMTTIKKKVNIFKNKLQKSKQKIFLQDKVPDKESSIFTRKTKSKSQAK